MTTGKNNTPFSRLNLSLLFIIATATLLLIEGCGSSTSSVAPDDEEENGESEIVLEEIPADGELETVTWNIEWYGSETGGPRDEELQTQNILEVIDSLKADLYAFQEVYSQEALNQITGSMKGYRGFVAPHINWIQKTAFVYNTATIDSISAGGITSSEGQDSYQWAGRFPLYFEFNYNYQGNSTAIYAVVIHGKAQTGDTQEELQEAYERRTGASDSLYTYLMEQKPDAHIILLGDYNDDVDVSIYEGEPTPYDNFVDSNQYFRVVTKTFSENGIASTVSYPDMVDHITISDELFDNFIDGSQQVYNQTGNFIEFYGSTTSDHYPVWAKFNLSGSQEPGISAR